MKILLRVVVTLVVVLSIQPFVYWLPFSLAPQDTPRWVPTVVSLICAAGAGWFVWSSSTSAQNSLFLSVLYGAITLGAIGFAAGFFGPLIVMPEANQGPLLGIFITGPAGFVLGAVGGFVYWAKGRPTESSASDDSRIRGPRS